MPQLDADVDRVKAKTQGMPLDNLFETLQIYLGSLYVNDFNRFGRTYEVIAQADSQFRAHPEDITRLKTRNDKGEMVPLGAVVKVTESHGPDRVMRYNGYPAAEINGAPAPGFSSGQAEAAMAKLVSENLPRGMAYEWTDLTYQRILAGNTALYVYPLCLLLVFLVLAALYESFRLPLAIILIVPMCLLFAITGVWLKGSDNNIFTQIGLIVLVGLACKNAILIVEFAKRKQDEGMSPFDAAIEACRLRLRPILMTSHRVHRGRFPARRRARRRRGNAAGHGHRRVLRHDRRDAVRIVSDAGVLCHADETRLAEKTCDDSRSKKYFARLKRGDDRNRRDCAAVHNCFRESRFADHRPGLQTADQFVPANYKAVEFGNWKEGQPLDNVPKGNWWEIFGDTNLNALEAQALQANQQLKAAVARVDRGARHRARRARRFAAELEFGSEFYARSVIRPTPIPASATSRRTLSARRWI